MPANCVRGSKIAFSSGFEWLPRGGIGMPRRWARWARAENTVWSAKANFNFHANLTATTSPTPISLATLKSGWSSERELRTLQPPHSLMNASNRFGASAGGEQSGDLCGSDALINRNGLLIALRELVFRRGIWLFEQFESFWICVLRKRWDMLCAAFFLFAVPIRTCLNQTATWTAQHIP